MARVKVLDTETTREDVVIKGLIGTIWGDYKVTGTSVIIPVAGGIQLDEGEYEII